MGGSRLGWALNAIAPWCVALGLVSITAEAGQDPAQGGSVAIEGAESPVRQALNAATFQLPDPFDGAGSSPYFVEASLTLGAPDELAAVDDEVDPRPDLKQVADAFPTVDRTLKGDPFLGLRPGFDARRLRRPTIIEGGATGPADGDGEVSFSEPYGSALSYSEETLGAGAPEWSAPAPAKEALTFDDGATPSVPLEAALNSATPAPSDDVPIATVAAKPEEPGADTSEIAKTLPNGQPDYASLIDQKDAARQQRCLAEAIYFEARSEPEDGQAAVAQVVLNRVRSGLYPANVCAVVYQDRNRPFACQFSFACEGKSLRITEPGPWAVATRIAQEVSDGKTYNARVGAALNYHANYVMPYWASALKRVDRIGHHIFYELRVSQN